jgi:3-oxoacyl-[acyl-carrier protein] reductase
MSNKLLGKVAVVTGAGRGIGRAEALALAKEGASVVVNDLGVDVQGVSPSDSPADEVVAEIKKSGGQAIANYDSVATSSGADRIIQSAIESFGKLDIMVNNAGLLKSHMIFNITDEEWDLIVKVHLYGHFYCTRAACRWFKQQKSGRIINTSSLAGLGVPGSVHYSAAKEGIVGLTRSVAKEMARYNVTCNVIRPEALTRMVDAGIKDNAKSDKNLKEKESFAAEVASLGVSTPEDIAPLVVYLATDGASNINGCTFAVRRGEISLLSEPSPIKTVSKDGFWTFPELEDALQKVL